MKPKNWDSLDKSQKLEIASNLLHSTRGWLLISQALSVAIVAMSKVETTRKETSNIQDLQMMQEVLFYLPADSTVEAVLEVMK